MQNVEDIVNDFYSLPPKCRTKKRLIKMLEKIYYPPLTVTQATNEEYMNKMQCVVCGSERSKDKYPDIGIVSCAVCGHVFYNAGIEGGDPSKIYNKSYFVDGLYGNYAADAPIIRKNFLRQKKEILRNCPEGGRLLEIGSAYGIFLDCVRDKFETTGFEASEHAAEHARGQLNLDVRNEDFLKSDINGSFDAACMFDTIEHLLRPDLYLEKLSSLLKAGGYFFATTGDINALLPRIMGRRWRLIEPPLHVHYFSGEGIKKLCASKGLEIISIKYLPVWRSIHQIARLALGVRGVEKMRPIGIPINTFDIMSVIARKIR